MALKLERNLLSVVILAFFATNAVLATQPMNLQRLENFVSTLKQTDLKQNDIKQKFESFTSKSIVECGDRGPTIIGMLKLLTMVKYHFKIEEYFTNWFWPPYVNAMKHLITDVESNKDNSTNAKFVNDAITSIKNNQAIANELFDWHTLLDLLTLLGRSDIEQNTEIEWTCFALMVVLEGILESSTRKKDFEITFTDEMMDHLNKICNQANAIWGIYSYNSLGDKSFPIRFKFDVIISKGNLSIRNGQRVEALKKHLKRGLAEDTVEEFISGNKHAHVNTRIDLTRYLERLGVTSYYALIQLSNDELSQQSHELAYAMELCRLISQSFVLSKCHANLKSQIDSPAYKNVKSEYTKQINEITTARNAVLRMSFIEKRTNPKYFEYVAITFNLITNNNDDNEKEVKRAFCQATQDMLNDKVLNDDKKFFEYNKYHIQLYGAGQYGIVNEWTKDKMEKQLVKILTKSQEILAKQTHSASDIDKLHILSRLGLQICESYFYYHAWDTTNDKKNQMRQDVASIYIKAMTLNSKFFADDWVALKLWIDFTQYHKSNVNNVFTQELITDLLNVVKEQIKKPNSKADVVLYIFSTRMAVLLAEFKRSKDATELTKNVFELEQKLERSFETETVQQYIYKLFVTHRQLYYMIYASDALKFAKKPLDLKHLIDHHIEIITSVDSFIDIVSDEYDVGYPIMVKYQLLKAIFDAIANEANAETLLKDFKGCLSIKQINAIYFKEIAGTEFAIYNTLPQGTKIENLFGAQKK